MSTSSHPVRRDLLSLAGRGATALGGPHRHHPSAAGGYREAAIVVLFSPAAESRGEHPDADLFLVQRLRSLRDHPGQISCPGGRLEPGESAVQAALRETEEETGLPRDRVEIIAELPRAVVPISAFSVRAFLGWAPHPKLGTADPSEVQTVLRLPVPALLDPEARSWVQIGDLNEHRSHGFATDAGWVWGFTGNLLAHVFDELGWTRPWDTSRNYRMSMAQARGAPG